MPGASDGPAVAASASLRDALSELLWQGADSAAVVDADGTARTVEGEAGATVMETAIKHGVPGIEAECGGACACSTCHVYIDEVWREKVGGPSPMEEDMLDFAYGVQPNSRLSCQIKVSEDFDGLTVRTPDRQA